MKLRVQKQLLGQQATDQMALCIFRPSKSLPRQTLVGLTLPNNRSEAPIETHRPSNNPYSNFSSTATAIFAGIVKG